MTRGPTTPVAAIVSVGFRDADGQLWLHTTMAPSVFAAAWNGIEWFRSHPWGPMPGPETILER